MRVDILMVTFAKDLPFAQYALQSINKFCSGFGRVLIVVPDSDVGAFQVIAEPFGFRVQGFWEREGKGMLHHMAVICEADRWCPEADAILHVDADCIFWEPCTPDDFVSDGKPVLYRERYDDFAAHETRYGWKKCVDDATGIVPDWETMVRHPGIFVPETYRQTRNLIANHTESNWREYILSCRNEFPQTFAEFPTLGAVALDLHPELYHWVDFSCQPSNNYEYEHGRDKLKAFWSHCGIDGTCDRHPGKTAREVIDEILK